jgi:hypothetical protein
MIYCCLKCSRFFCNITQQVLPDNQLAMLKEPDTQEDNRAGKKTHGLDIKEYIIPGLVETCCTENMGMGFRMPFSDKIHDLPRIPGRYTFGYPACI